MVIRQERLRTSRRTKTKNGQRRLNAQDLEKNSASAMKWIAEDNKYPEIKDEQNGEVCSNCVAIGHGRNEYPGNEVEHEYEVMNRDEVLST